MITFGKILDGQFVEAPTCRECGGITSRVGDGWACVACNSPASRYATLTDGRTWDRLHDTAKAP